MENNLISPFHEYWMKFLSYLIERQKRFDAEVYYFERDKQNKSQEYNKIQERFRQLEKKRIELENDWKLAKTEPYLISLIERFEVERQRHFLVNPIMDSWSYWVHCEKSVIINYNIIPNRYAL